VIKKGERGGGVGKKLLGANVAMYHARSHGRWLELCGHPYHRQLDVADIM
jgi:hypothetical protein